MAIITASLAGSLIRNIIAIGESKLFGCAQCWAIIIANAVAIIGVLWLIQNYRKRRRLEQAQKETEKEEETKANDNETKD